jgi:hypothetical protein
VSAKDPLIEAVTPKTNWFVVLRPFDGNSVKFVRGEVVDTTGWRHTGMLESRRYIAPLPYGATLPDELEQADGTMRRIFSPQTDKKKPARR